MTRTIRAIALGALAGLLAVALAACGSSSESPSGSVQSPKTEAQTGGVRGGTLTVLNHQDFEHIDPGEAYFVNDYEMIYATQRPLFSYKPNTFVASPDLASEPAQISADGKTVTVHIRHGVRFSPPVNREVTSADVAYAIERGANPNVANPYFSSYYSAVVGAEKATGGPIPGIVTPDKHTIVFHLEKPLGQLLVNAFVLPLSAPVPPEFAKPLDAKKPTEYGAYQVASGPYMFKANGAGKVIGIGYQPGKSATLVRNPNWSAQTDFRPAYLDQIDVNIGGDPTVIGRQVLQGSHLVQNDTAAQSTVKLAYEKYRSQLEISPGAGDHYIAIDNKHGPFANINVRKAFWAALDREAMNKARGGKLVTDVMTHFIYPEIPGFEEAGGMQGPKVDYNEHPQGDMTVAAKYLKLAGYPSGKYTGGEPVEIVGSTGNPAAQDAEIVNSTLKKLGFTTKFNLVDQSVMYAKYCGVPHEQIDVCPSAGWVADFGDAQAVLEVPFSGASIHPTSNPNWGQVDNPQINKAMEAAALVKGDKPRAEAWAKIDRELVEQAAAVPYDWDKQPVVRAKDVVGVGDLWNVGSWDYNYTSLK